MKDSPRRKIAFALLIGSLVAGIAALAAFPAPKPGTPVRLFMKSNGGTVLFSHKDHAALKSYGPATCDQCHHTGSLDTRTASSCADCHDADDPAYAKDLFVHKAHITDYGQTCDGCHQNAMPKGREIRGCRGCHKADSDVYGPKSMDAFHGQCIRCHEEKAKGPTACDRCHFQEGKRPSVPEQHKPAGSKSGKSGEQASVLEGRGGMS